MKSVLEELYYGNIRPFASRNAHLTKTHILHMEDFRRQFLDTLTENQKECFDAYEAHMSEIASDAECNSFVRGFRLGLRIVLDGIRED